MKRVLSLFDHTGTWSQPYWDAGFDVFEVDLKNWIAVDINSIQSAQAALEDWGDFDIILAAPPCTDFSVSGAQYWKKKDRDGRTAASVELVRQVMRLVDLYKPTDPEYVQLHGDLIWCVENPIGRIARLVRSLGDPWRFDPCDFAGYVSNGHDESQLNRIRNKNGERVTTREADFVVKCNAYTKRTQLFGNFTRPKLARIEPVRLCPQGSFTQRLGGKSERTKELRSITPEGFAQAFFQVNQ